MIHSYGVICFNIAVTLFCCSPNNSIMQDNIINQRAIADLNDVGFSFT